MIAHEVDELGVAGVVPAVERFLSEELVAVLDALFLLELGLGSVHARRAEARVAADHRCLLEDDEVLDACIEGCDRGAHACSAGADDHDVVVFRGRIR